MIIDATDRCRFSNVRIPETPAMLLRMIREFSLLRDVAEADGYYWPDTLEAWAELIEGARARS